MAEALLRVQVVWSPGPRQTRECDLALSPGVTVAQALAAAGLAHWQDDGWVCAVWGRAVAPDAPLCDGDRVECLRPLLVDPKVARRERFASQGKRTAGLFAKRQADKG